MTLVLRAMRTFDENKAMEILYKLASGMSMPQLVRDGIVPDEASVWLWARANKAFGVELKIALETSAHVLSHKALDMSADLSYPTKDKVVAIAQCNRLASKYAPTVYGDQQMQVISDDIESMSEEELDQKRIDLLNEVAEMMMKAKAEAENSPYPKIRSLVNDPE